MTTFCPHCNKQLTPRVVWRGPTSTAVLVCEKCDYRIKFDLKNAPETPENRLKTPEKRENMDNLFKIVCDHKLTTDNQK